MTDRKAATGTALSPYHSPKSIGIGRRNFHCPKLTINYLLFIKFIVFYVARNEHHPRWQDYNYTVPPQMRHCHSTSVNENGLSFSEVRFKITGVKHLNIIQRQISHSRLSILRECYCDELSRAQYTSVSVTIILFFFVEREEAVQSINSSFLTLNPNSA